MKKKILNFLMTHKKDIKTSVLALSLGILLAGYPAFAATSGLDTSKLTQIANNWVVPICTALAVIFGALGGLQFALSYKKHQQGGEYDGITNFIVAVILLGVDAFVALFT